MSIQLLIRVSALLGALTVTGALYAQAEQTPERILDEPLPEAPQEPAAPEETDDSREVDFNEENFRRSMELRDQQLQRSPDLTTGTYSPDTVHQLLDDLPEASQKHLREELREVIVQNGPWTPEQAGEIYPYVPSAEAEKNGGLEKREEAAWQELVARYHEREAAIRGLGQAGQPGDGKQTGKAGESGEAGQTAQAGSQGQGTQGSQGDASQQAAERAAARAAALAEMMNSGQAGGQESASSGAPAVPEGVSQNALQLLTERQQVPAAASSAAAASSNTAAATEKGQAPVEEPEMRLDSTGVIAIEDLKNVELNPKDSEEN